MGAAARRSVRYCVPVHIIDHHCTPLHAIAHRCTASQVLHTRVAYNIEEIFGDEYPSKPDGHNWPRSYEQYKNQVGGLQEDMDAVYDLLDEYEETIKELEKGHDRRDPL